MKSNILMCVVLCCILCQIPAKLLAQHDLSLYHMQMIPQRIFQNPAFIPQQKFYLGVPVLSGLQTAYANPFSYNNLIERDSYDSITFRVDNFLEKIQTNDLLRATTSLEILSLGTRIAQDRFFVGFSIRERYCQQVTIPVNLANLLWYGNAAPQLFGQHANIAPAVNMMAYDEWGASFSGYALNQKMTWGGRLKYLSGRFNATTTKAEFDMYTDTSTYELYMKSDLELKTSGIDNIEHYLDQRVQSLVFPGNNGFGIDLGLSYRFNEHVDVSASVLDIGFITWKTNNMTFVSHNPGEAFSFNGLTLDDFVDMLGNLDNFGEKLTDSVADLINIDTVYGGKYTTWLPVKYNLSGSYSINDHHRFNLLLNGISWAGRFNPALSVSYYFQAPGIFGFMVSYNLYNNQYTNIGAGLSLNAGPIQLYVVSDNIPGLVYYKGTNNSSVQFGINISVFRKKAAPQEAPAGEQNPDGTVK